MSAKKITLFSLPLALLFVIVGLARADTTNQIYEVDLGTQTFGGPGQNGIFIDTSSTCPGGFVIGVKYKTTSLAYDVIGLDGYYTDTDYYRSYWSDRRFGTWLTYEIEAGEWYLIKNIVYEITNNYGETHDRYWSGLNKIKLWADHSYAREVTAICYGPPPTPPTLDPVCSDTIGKYSSLDLAQAGTLTAGSLTSYRYSEGPFGSVYRLTFSRSVTLPVQSLGSGLQQAYLRYELVGSNMQPQPASITISGMTYTVMPGEWATVSVPGGATSITVSFDEFIDRTQYIGPGDEPLSPYVASMTLTYPAINDGDTVLCDGGMEKLPKDSAWMRLREDQFFARQFTSDPLAAVFNGAPICGSAFQHEGNTVIDAASPGVGSPVYQKFAWNGGTAYYKFRYRTYTNFLAQLFSITPGSPNVYIVDDAGSVVADLYGGTNLDPSLQSGDWKLITGSIDLNQGYYALVLDQGYVYTSSGGIDYLRSGRVAYDDVAFGTKPQETSCSAWIEEPPPPASTPTPTPSVSPTPTQTPTGSPPPGSTGTATGTPTVATITSTPYGTPTASPSPRATATLRPSSTPYPSYTPLPSFTPYPTYTPYGTPAPTNTPVPNNTPGAPTNTPVPLDTPSLPGFQPTPPASNGVPEGWNPLGTPVPGGSSGGMVSCNYECRRPGFLEVAHWIDYSVCQAQNYTCWGAEHNATAVAIISQFSTYEPFGSMVEISQGVNAARTQIASAQIGYGAPGVNDPITPNLGSMLKKNSANDPWAEGGNFGQIFGQNASGSFGYTPYCNTKLSTVLSSRLASGTCYALDALRRIGMLAWVQFLINCYAIFMIVRNLYGIIMSQISARSSQPVADEPPEEVKK